MDTNVTPTLGSLASSIDWRAIENLIILNLILFRSWAHLIFLNHEEKSNMVSY